MAFTAKILSWRLNIVGCLLKRRPTKGGHGHPRTPPLATPLPYIRGTSETIAGILQPDNIRVAHKLITTLRQLLTNVKGKDKLEDR